MSALYFTLCLLLAAVNAAVTGKQPIGQLHARRFHQMGGVYDKPSADMVHPKQVKYVVTALHYGMPEEGQAYLRVMLKT